MLRSGLSGQAIVDEELLQGNERVYGKFDDKCEQEFIQLHAPPSLIEALKSGKYAPSEAQRIAWEKTIKQQQQGALTAVEIEGQRMATQAAQERAKETAEKERHATQAVQIAVAPAQSGITFKLPSEKEADRKAAEAAKIAERKRYCEADPVECETLAAAQQAQSDAQQAQSDLESLKTTLFMQGGRP